MASPGEMEELLLRSMGVARCQCRATQATPAAFEQACFDQACLAPAYVPICWAPMDGDASACCWAPVEGNVAAGCWAPPMDGSWVPEAPAAAARSGSGRRGKKGNPRARAGKAPTGAVAADPEQVAELQKQLGDSETVGAAVAAMRGNFASLAFHAQGCRVAQTALEVAGRADQAELVQELHGRVWEAVQCPHANYVLQKVVEVAPPVLATFVVEELQGSAVEVAQHVFGCRIFCRLLEHCPHAQTASIIHEVLKDVAVLCRHRYGNYVIQHVLEHGTAEQKKIVAHSILGDVVGLASHRTGSNVVEQAIAHCAAEERRLILIALLSDADAFEHLAGGRYGSYVARVLLRLPGGPGEEARRFLALVAPALQGSKYGQRVLAEPFAAAEPSAMLAGAAAAA